MGYAQGVVGFVTCRWVRWVALWWCSGSFGVAGFIGVRRRVRSVNLGSALVVVVGSCGLVGFIGVHPGGREVRSGSLRSLGCALVVVGFVRGCWVYLGAPPGT